MSAAVGFPDPQDRSGVQYSEQASQELWGPSHPGFWPCFTVWCHRIASLYCMCSVSCGLPGKEELTTPRPVKSPH